MSEGSCFVLETSQPFHFVVNTLTDSTERDVENRIIVDDDAALFALKLNVFNIVNNEIGQQSWHHNTGEVSNNHNLYNQRNNGYIDTRWQYTKDAFSHKRFSLNLEGSSHHYPTMLSDFPEFQGNGALHTKHFNHQSTVGEKNKKKRRLSNLGCLTSTFFEDYAKAVRRGSMASASSFAVSNHESNRVESDDDDSVISQMSDGVGFESIEHARFQVYPRPNLSEVSIKQTMEMFYDAMSMSQKSQHAIHDWDKKMGLKRSHSKTMRLSMRSRKKLKAMIKKDMLHLSNGR
jgi:hypothetical protein